jgi:hypothetical protein
MSQNSEYERATAYKEAKESRKEKPMMADIGSAVEYLDRIKRLVSGAEIDKMKSAIICQDAGRVRLILEQLVQELEQERVDGQSARDALRAHEQQRSQHADYRDTRAVAAANYRKEPQ